MRTHVEVRRGSYHDSVTLLGVSQGVQRVDGVDQALVAMATDLNLEVFRDLGFDDAALGDASPNDLLVAVRAGDDVGLRAALAEVERALTARATPASGVAGEPAPRTVRRAAARGDADLALISVPGANAFVEAVDALRAGLHVMVFSDNVPVEQEVALKAEGTRRGLLVMGPDCGTAIVGGVGLGFANVVRPGPVGVVAASGTGAQQVCCLLDDADVGISAVLGVGGRDLSAEVGGAATLQALEALDDDPATELIVVVSKPPDPAVAALVRDRMSACATPVVPGFVGRGMADLTAVVAQAVERLGGVAATPRRWGPPQPPQPRTGAVRGLFSGGTLCDEAMAIAAADLGPIASNIPLDPAWITPDAAEVDGHMMLDFGDDALTRGRPHPMIDHSLRLTRIAREAERPGDHVLLLDVVLGHGADGDPAAAFAPALRAACGRAADRGDRLAVVVSLCGTADDPQGLERQGRTLAEAGAVVHLSNARAARDAVRLAGGGEV